MKRKNLLNKVEGLTDNFMFSYSRFSLLYGLKELGFTNKDVVLVPDYNCDVIYYPLRQLGLELHYYSLKDNFTPDWESVRKNIKSSTRAIMMVHYFGQPQPIDEFIRFAHEYKLLLIEDNAHGHSGSYKGKLLGTFGDIGFGSPRKQLNLEYGATLYIQGNQIFSPVKRLSKMHVTSFKIELLKAIPRIRILRFFFKKYILSKPNFVRPEYFLEDEISDVLPDRYASNRIKNTDWKVIGEQRRESWNQWTDFCKKRGLTPIWDQPDPSSCPWIMPAYAANEKTRTMLLNASWEAGLGLLPWPSLPKYVLDHCPEAMRRWKLLVCFPLNKMPNEHRSEIRSFDEIISRL